MFLVGHSPQIRKEVTVVKVSASNKRYPQSSERFSQRPIRTFLYIAAFFTAQMMCFAATISVITAGATGNGSTDDTAAIQFALNSSAAGDTLVFPTGTYRISSHITVPSNRTLQGQSGSIIKGSIGGALLQGVYDNTRNLTIDGLTFDVSGSYNADGIHAWTGTTNSQISSHTFTTIYDASRVAGDE